MIYDLKAGGRDIKPFPAVLGGMRLGAVEPLCETKLKAVVGSQ
jgi:hypothetical protein